MLFTFFCFRAYVVSKSGENKNFLKILFLSNFYTQHAALTYNPKIKSWLPHQLSLPDDLKTNVFAFKNWCVQALWNCAWAVASLPVLLSSLSQGISASEVFCPQLCGVFQADGISHVGSFLSAVPSRLSTPFRASRR